MAENVLEVPGFGSSILQCLHNQQKEGKFCDLQLKTTTGFVPVHHCVLLAAVHTLGEDCPNWFGEMIENDNIIISSDVYSQDLVEKFILLLYTGKLVVSDEDFNNLRGIALKFRLSKLLQMLLALKSIKRYGKQFDNLPLDATYYSQKNTNIRNISDLKRKNDDNDNPSPKRSIHHSKHLLCNYGESVSACDIEEVVEKNNADHGEMYIGIKSADSAHVVLDELDMNCIDDTAKQSLSSATCTKETKEAGTVGSVERGDSPENAEKLKQIMFFAPNVKQEIVDDDFMKTELTNEAGKDESDEEEETEMVSKQECKSVKHKACMTDDAVDTTVNTMLQQGTSSWSPSKSEMAVPRYLIKNVSSPNSTSFNFPHFTLPNSNQVVEAIKAGEKKSTRSTYCECSKNPEKGPLTREINFKAIDSFGNLLRKSFEQTKSRIQKKNLNNQLVHLSRAREKLLVPLQCKKAKHYPPMVLKGHSEVCPRKKSTRKSKYLSRPVIETMQLDADLVFHEDQALTEKTAQGQHKKNVYNSQRQTQDQNLICTKPCSVVLRPLELDMSLEINGTCPVTVKREIR